MNRPVLLSCLLILCLATPGARANAQNAVNDTELYATPGARALAIVKKGAALSLGDTSGDFVQATVEGWIAAPLLGASRDSFAVSVNGSGGARLRASASPNASVVAELRGGMGLQEIARQGAWVRVRRAGWLRASRVSLAQASGVTAQALPGAPPPAVSTSPVTADTTDVAAGSVPLTPAAETSLLTAPDGERVANIQPGARVVVTGRDRGWVRVRIEGWAHEADFVVSDTSLRGALSAADLRADPDGTKGRLVHWEVLVLAHQVADPLRKGLVNQEPYLLAQGPGRENALLYLAIPPALVATAREIPDLSTVTVTARVRSGKSEPVGVPVLDLISIVRR
jgi:SH3-like domain-containing protein